MRKLDFYYIYDNINECVIGEKPFFAPNDLSALIIFRDTFIKNEKSIYNYKTLDLIRFASADVDPDGNFIISANTEDIKPKKFKGSEVMTYIKAMCDELGIEDDLLEEEGEKK